MNPENNTNLNFNIKKKAPYHLINSGNIKNNYKSIKILDYISLVKILSSCLVILKHTNANYWVYNEYWISTNIMCSFCMCAVPLFGLCIGATLLNFNERYGIKEFWKRRIFKVIIPIIGWNIVYYFYRVYVIKNFPKIKLNFLNIYQIYFGNKLYPIIGSLRIFIFGYMIIPLISFIDKSNKIKIYSYGLLIIIINISTIPYLINIFYYYSSLLNKSNPPNISAIIKWPYNFDSGYSIFLFAGYIIQNNKFNLKSKAFIYTFGLLGLLLRLMISHQPRLNT